MKNTELTRIEKEAILEVLASAITCFDKAEYHKGIGYTDGGNFICSLDTKKHIKALDTAYGKIILI